MRGPLADFKRFCHMRDAILEIQDFVSGMSEDDFYRDN